MADQKDSNWDNNYHDCKYTKYYDGDDDGGNDSNWDNNYHDSKYPKYYDGYDDDGGNGGDGGHDELQRVVKAAMMVAAGQANTHNS